MLKKFLVATFVCLLLILVTFNNIVPLRADELEEIEKKLADLKHTLELSQKATQPLEQSLEKLKLSLDDLRRRIGILELEVAKKEKEVKEGEELLGQQEGVLAKRVRAFYIRQNKFNPLVYFLTTSGFSDWIKEFTYQQRVTNEDKKIITQVVLYIKDLEEKKINLENEKLRLAKVKEETDKQAGFLGGEIAKAKDYQDQLSGEIAKLTTRQQQLLAEKYGGFTTSVGNVPLADDPNSQPSFDPGFRPAFAAFSFGAPHRVGMNQYGAFGRAKAGQSAEQILSAYYSGVELKKDYPVPDSIDVQGYGRIPFEDLYLKGIAEMPSSWGDEGGMEALKAQAIAARTYALAATNNGQGSICASEACQVFIGRNKGGKWEEAVNSTKGWVLVSAGVPIKAWYASTAGGITLSSAAAWGSETSYAKGIVDTTCGNSSCWPNDAYDGVRHARSPWFYKGWYKRYHAASSSRSHPWLTQAEFADIINGVLLYKADNQTLVHLSQTDKSNPDTWSQDKVKEELKNRGSEPVFQISEIPTPQYSTAGYTVVVSFETDKGTKRFNGDDFKTIFNLRAPGEIHLASSLYNIEKK